MKQLTTLTLLGLMTMMLTACGGGEHEAVADDAIVIMEEMATTMESIKDEASLEASVKKFDDIATKMEELGKRIEGLPKLPQAEADALEKKMEAKMKELQPRLEKQPDYLKENPLAALKLMKPMQRIMAVGQKLQSIGK